MKKLYLSLFLCFIFLLPYSPASFANNYQFYMDKEHPGYSILGDSLRNLSPKKSPGQPQAVIVGGGIAGLSTALALKKKDFDVIVFEERHNFDRFNMVNLKVEVESTFKELGIFEDFLNVSKRLTEHLYFRDNETEPFMTSSVESLSSTGEKFFADRAPLIFQEDGVYSVVIGELQQFLARKAQEEKIPVFIGTEAHRSKQDTHIIIAKQGDFTVELHPDLIIFSDGAGGRDDFDQKGLNKDKKKDKEEEKTEMWIFGNVAYSGSKAFVIAMMDYSDPTFTEIANVIFNPRLQEANIAVTVRREKMSLDQIKENIERIAERAFRLGKVYDGPIQTRFTVKTVVKTPDRRLDTFTLGDRTLFAGDRAGSSSPLAGLGATLGLTSYPFGIQRVGMELLRTGDLTPALQEYAKQTEAYLDAWTKGSAKVRNLIETKLNPKKSNGDHP